MNILIIYNLAEVVNNKERNVVVVIVLWRTIAKFQYTFSIILKKMKFIFFSMRYPKFHLNIKIHISIIFKYIINIIYLNLLEQKCSNKFNFYSAVSDIKSNGDINFIKNVYNKVNYNNILINNKILNGIFHFINNLKRANSKDFITKWSWLPFNFEINLEEYSNYDFINMIYNFNTIFILLVLFLVIVLYRSRYYLWILINIRNIYLLNHFYYLRYVLLSSIFLLYFIYSYINLSIDFKEMYKLFDLLFSKNTMFIDYVNNKFGFNISFIDPSDYINYVSNGNNDIGNQMNNPDSPVNIDKLPRKVHLSEYTSCSENDDDSEGIENDSDVSEEHSDASEDEEIQQHKAKKVKYDTTEPVITEADLGPNPEFVESAHRFTKMKEKKNNIRYEMKDAVDGLNQSVDDMEKTLKSAKIVNTENVDSTKIHSTLNKGSNSSLKRTYDMINDTEMNNTKKEAYFPSKDIKNEFLSDLSEAKRHTNKLNNLVKDYDKVKSKLNKVRDK